MDEIPAPPPPTVAVQIRVEVDGRRVSPSAGLARYQADLELEVDGGPVNPAATVVEAVRTWLDELAASHGLDIAD